MTVCIAVIYNDNAILGVSDRMLTAGNMQFEPMSPKILNPSNSIAVLTAGDSDIQTQIYEIVAGKVNELIAADPTKWVLVEDVARMYRDTYVEIRREFAEAEILAPLGLTWSSYISQQKLMNEQTVQDLTYRLMNFTIASAHTIVTGIDEMGPHIFVVRNDIMSNSDKVGFAAVGSGSSHALSHIMLSKHSRTTSEPKALLTIHQAKKKAEVSPGVGKATDLFVLGPNLGTFNMLSGPNTNIPLVDDLDNFYDEYTKAIELLDEKTEASIGDYIEKTAQSANQSQEADPQSPEQPAKNSDSLDKVTKSSKKKK